MHIFISQAFLNSKLPILIHREPTRNPSTSTSFCESYSMVWHFGCRCNWTVLFEDEHGLWSGLWQQLGTDICCAMYFHQDVTHAWMGMEKLNKKFLHCWISQFGELSWLPRSPDLSAPNYFLWDYLKNRVFETQPATMDELKAKRFKLCPMIFYNAWWMISLSTSKTASLWKGGIHCILFSKCEQYMYQT
jgi:hypothetical protein